MTKLEAVGVLSEIRSLADKNRVVKIQPYTFERWARALEVLVKEKK